MSDDFFDTSHEGRLAEPSENRVGIGDEVNLQSLDPGLKNILVGAGWEINTYSNENVDVDLSVFLLNAQGETRVDEDFIFYNAPEGCDGAVRHTGDSQTGAGDGDDETVKIDLNAIPFDVVRVIFTLSIYKGAEQEQSLDMVHDGFLRIVNAETNMELVRYVLVDDMKDRPETAMVTASLNREGPKWHFTPVGEFVPGGLQEIATRYGLMVINQ